VTPGRHTIGDIDGVNDGGEQRTVTHEAIVW
jgi:hypothetical protein